MADRATRSAAPRCASCGGAVATLLDFGPQPPSNRFLASGERETDLHRLAMGQCSACGLVQLVDPMPAAMVRSRFPWLTYNEPEGHLDALVERLVRLPGIGPESLIAGLTYKDDSTLARLNRLGFARTFRLDMSADLGLEDGAAGLESVQEAVREHRTREIAARRGRASLLVARHVLEHAHDPRAFVDGLAPLVKPGGYLVLEMPDSRKFLGACDYSFAWEEHITYFSPATLAAFFRRSGCGVAEILAYPYALEDSLVAIVRPGEPAREAGTEGLAAELARGHRYAERFHGVREGHRARLSRLRASGKRVVLFGAGHLAAKFVNLFELRDYIDCVVDDNPNKQLLVMPGSRLPIRSSSLLERERIDLCLLSLSPESEKKVLAARKAYIERGGEFRSIFALSPLALGA
jgi:C-methyltransferase-like protein/methyltransferase family protein/putative zinc binding protein